MADTWAVNNGAVSYGPPRRGKVSRDRPNQVNSKVPAGKVATVGYGAGQVDPRLARAAAAKETPPVANPAAYVDGIGWMQKGRPSTAEVASRKQAAAQSNTNTVTYSGTNPATNPATVRTNIIDASGKEANILVDSFLQGLQGGLSSIFGSALTGLLSKLPGSMQNLLSSTALSGALGGAFSGALGNALNGLSNALGGAVSKIAGDLGAAISGIPGIGPIFDGFTKSLGAFTNNLDVAIKGLPPELQNVIANAAFDVGANIVGKVVGKPNIQKDVRKQVMAEIEFQENPVALARNLANSADALNRKTYATTGDRAFADVASQAKKVAKKFGTRLVKKNPYVFKLSTIPENPVTRKVVDGKLYTTKERREFFGEKSSPAKEYQRAYNLVLNDEQINQIVNDNVVPPEVVIAVSELTVKEQDEILAGRIPKTIEKSYVDAVEVKAKAQPKQEVKINTANIVEVKPESQSVVVETRNNDNVLISREEYEIKPASIPPEIQELYDDYEQQLEEWKKTNKIIIGTKQNSVITTNLRRITLKQDGFISSGTVGGGLSVATTSSSTTIIPSAKELRKAVKLVREKYDIPPSASLTNADFDADGNLIGAEFKKAPPEINLPRSSFKPKFGGPLVRKEVLATNTFSPRVNRLEITRQRRSNIG